MTRRYKFWSEDEKEIIRLWIKENPGKTESQGAKELGKDWPHLNYGQIKSAINKQKLYLRKDTKQKDAQEISPASTKEALGLMVLKLREEAERINVIADTIEEITKDVALIEDWARDTLTVRERLLAKVDKNGIVHKVEKPK